MFRRSRRKLGHGWRKLLVRFWIAICWWKLAQAACACTWCGLAITWGRDDCVGFWKNWILFALRPPSTLQKPPSSNSEARGRRWFQHECQTAHLKKAFSPNHKVPGMSVPTQGFRSGLAAGYRGGVGSCGGTQGRGEWFRSCGGGQGKAEMKDTVPVQTYLGPDFIRSCKRHACPGF